MPEQPKILILTPVKNAKSYLPKYVELIEALDWPRHLFSLGMLEGDSSDGTAVALRTLQPRLEARCRRVTLGSHDYGFRMPPGIHRWEPAFQLGRRNILARARNRLLSAALDDEDWVLWIDVDIIAYPTDIISRLLAPDFDIVTPHCVTMPGGGSFDANSWTDYGKTLLQHRRGTGAMRLDAVGGTMLLVRADLHRDGLIFPPFPYGVANNRIRPQGEIETEGLGIMAADMGVQCWGLPDLEIYHIPT